jgi:hypothetical protein
LNKIEESETGEERPKTKDKTKSKDKRKRRVMRYLRAKSLLHANLEQKRKEQMREPRKHPKYQSTWDKYYAKKCKQNGGEPVAHEEIEYEWIEVWSCLFSDFHAEEVTQEEERLLKKQSKKVKKFVKKMKRAAYRSKSESQMTASVPVSLFDRTMDRNGNRYDNVLIHLRYFSVYEKILGELRSDLIKNLYRARDLEEEEGEGASNEMIHDADFFKLLSKVRERLMTEVIALPRRLEDYYLNLAMLLIRNINRFLERSKCYKPELALGDQLSQ